MIEVDLIPSYGEILKQKIDYYGETMAAYQFAGEEYQRQVISFYNLKPVLVFYMPGMITPEQHGIIRESLKGKLDGYESIIMQGAREPKVELLSIKGATALEIDELRDKIIKELEL